MIAWARRTVNDSELTKRDRQPATALTVMMALHPHLINPNHHLPRATQKSQRRFWPRAPCHARLCDRLNLRASPLTGHCAGGGRDASSAFAEPLTVHSLTSAATLSTAPTRGTRGANPAHGTVAGTHCRLRNRTRLCHLLQRVHRPQGVLLGFLPAHRLHPLCAAVSRSPGVVPRLHHPDDVAARQGPRRWPATSGSPRAPT